MIPSILALGTALPPTRLSQADTRDLFARQPGLDRRAQRLVRAAFDAAAIETRHTVLPQLAGEPTDGLRVVDDAGILVHPPTGSRNEEFRRSAPALFESAARDALIGAEIRPERVTHVVTISCTGLFAPGPDYLLVRDLGLAPGVQRYNLGFVGCAAAIPGLRLASHIAASDPTAVVLVVAAELCSLHVRSSDDPEQIVAASVFADGAAAAVVSADPAFESADRLELGDFGTQLIPEGEDDMSWTIGDSGFEMTLTAQVPRLVGRHAREALAALGGDASSVDAWAVHPGGRSVLDRVEQALELPTTALTASRTVLRDHGNMSSATILFVLRELWQRTDLADGARIAAMAFGPGLTVEAAKLVRRGSAAPAEAARIAPLRETVAG